MAKIPTPLRLLHWWARHGVSEQDSDDLRLKKEVMTIVSSAIALLAIFWGALYAVTGYPWSGAIPWSYTVIVLISTLHFFHSKQFDFFLISQQWLILLLPYFLMWSLGGFANSSAVMIWAFFAPLAALFFVDLRAAGRWMLVFLLLLVLSALLDPWLAARARPMPQWLNTLYFLMNLGLGFSLVALMLYYFVKDRERAYQQLQHSQAHIEQLLLTDDLTRVGNRRSLNERLQEELARVRRYGSPLSVIMIDADHFKVINDRYGHAVGDEVLVALAHALQECVRDSDFLARYGGEEFMVLLPETGRDGAVAMAERMRGALKKLRIGPLESGLSASFGVTEVHEQDNVDRLLNRVDEAMYEAKRSGRDRVCIL
ncbi:MAG: GGDEF domain-containing protein [Pseudomonadota bacterium]|nr:GGDEF domain-containing protein [Pseudomonadota bacterium]